MTIRSTLAGRSAGGNETDVWEPEMDKVASCS